MGPGLCAGRLQKQAKISQKKAEAASDNEAEVAHCVNNHAFEC